MAYRACQSKIAALGLTPALAHLTSSPPRQVPFQPAVPMFQAVLVDFEQRLIDFAALNFARCFDQGFPLIQLVCFLLLDAFVHQPLLSL